VPKPVRAPAPKTLDSADGILQWNPTKGVFEPTGFTPPARSRASEDPADVAARTQRESRLRTKDALAATMAQIKDLAPAVENARADVVNAQSRGLPVDPAELTRIEQMAQSLGTLRRDTDSLRSATKSPVSAARYDAASQRFVPLTATTPSVPSASPLPTPIGGRSIIRGGDVDSRDVADAQKAWHRIQMSRGKITMQDALTSTTLTPGTKEQLKRLAGIQ
jgi:hypothetical protein